MPRKRNPFKQEAIEFARFQKNAEKEILPIIRKTLRKSVAPVEVWVKLNGIENVPVDILIDKEVWRSMYLNIFNKIGNRAARKEYYNQRRAEQIQTKQSAIDFFADIWSGKLRDYALEYTYRIERELNDRTVEIIQQALGNTGVMELDRQGRIRFFLKEIEGKLRKRSLTISRTEASTIANLGKEIGAVTWIDEQGGGGYHMWLGRVTGERPEHLEVNNTILPIGEPYTVGGELALRPGDTNLSAKLRINCRCSQSIMSNNRYNALVKRGRIINGKVV